MLLLLILRGTFVLIVAAIAFLYAEQIPALAERRVAAILFAVMGAFLIVVVDMVWPRKSLRALAGVLFGLLAGMFVAYVFSLTVNFLASVFIARPESMKVMELVEQTQQALSRESPDVLAAKSLLMQAVRASRAPSFLLQFIKFMVGAVSCYLTISFVMQTKDDFRFVVPYVEFSRQTKGGRSFLLDTSVIIDGRIADVCKTGVIESEIIIPRFVLQELQGIAEAQEKARSAGPGYTQRHAG